MNLQRRLLLLLVSLVSMAAALLLLQTTPDAGAQLQIGSRAPNFEAESDRGDRIRLADLRGRPVIVNFWATWCGPCAQEMPILQSIVDTFAASGLRVLAVNTGETAAEIAAWRAQYGLRYDLLLDPDQHLGLVPAARATLDLYYQYRGHHQPHFLWASQRSGPAGRTGNGMIS